jgi:hypothetical protein
VKRAGDLAVERRSITFCAKALSIRADRMEK